MKTEMTDRVRVDLNKTPDAAAIKHAFFFCPICKALASTVTEPCKDSICSESVYMLMSCDSCKAVAKVTHWQVH